ncbi:hypothetical protein CDU35_05670 [Campylobacter coli]|nr:hypothetical protein [Campylobacter coli]
MIYCDHCVMPNTRPGINFTKDKEGKNICSACINHKNKENIDYKARFKELEALCDKYCRRKNKISIWKNKTSIKVEILFFYKP